MSKPDVELSQSLELSARECSWRLIDGVGFETATLSPLKSGWAFHGNIKRLIEKARVEVEYIVVCDRNWKTKTARVIVCDGTENRTLDLCNDIGLWFKDGERCPALDGCTDVDLEWSPSTNTLPIRRLNIPVGTTREPVTAAWIRLPELVVQPLPQSYQRTSLDTYLYRSHWGAFEARLTVDRDGLVIDYEGKWERE